VLQSGIGLVDPAAYQSFKKALSSGAPADFENIVLGGPRTLNGPQGGLAFYLECLDGSQFVVQAAAELSSLAAYTGPRNAANQVTPDLSFRGGYAGETFGPYISQFCRIRRRWEHCRSPNDRSLT
jgi:hypothetical protein